MVGIYRCMCMLERIVVVCKFDMQSAAKFFHFLLFILHFLTIMRKMSRSYSCAKHGVELACLNRVRLE